MIVTEREREAETQTEGEAGSMHWEPDVGFDPGSPGSRPGPKAGAKPLHHPGIPRSHSLNYHVMQPPQTSYSLRPVTVKTMPPVPLIPMG